MMRRKNKSTTIPQIEVLYLSNDLPGWYIPHSDCLKRLSTTFNCQRIAQFEIVILLKIHSENCNFIISQS